MLATGTKVRVVEIGCDCADEPVRCDYRFHRFEGGVGRVSASRYWPESNAYAYDIDFGEGTYGPFYGDEIQPA